MHVVLIMFFFDAALLLSKIASHEGSLIIANSSAHGFQLAYKCAVGFGVHV